MGQNVKYEIFLKFGWYTYSSYQEIAGVEIKNYLDTYHRSLNVYWSEVPTLLNLCVWDPAANNGFCVTKGTLKSTFIRRY